MDRKALLAVALSTLLIIVYQIVFAPPPREPVGQDTPEGVVDQAAPREEPVGSAYSERAVSERADVGASIATDGTEESAPPLFDDESEARTIEISTPLYMATIDTRGATFRSIQLLDFNDPVGEPVELIPEGGRGFGLLLKAGEREIDVRRRVFSSDRNRIRLESREDEGVLVLEEVLANGIRIKRTFRFRGDTYGIDVKQTIDRGVTSPEIYSYRVQWEPGIAFTEGDPDQEKREMAAVTMLGEKIIRDKAGKVGEDEGALRTGDVRWTAVKNKYFAIAMIPENVPDADVRIERIAGEERVSLDMKIPVRGSGYSETDFRLYAGPLDMNILKEEGLGLEGMIDLGWSAIRPVSGLTLRLILILNRYVHNYGLVIILISLITKILFYRLTHKSFKSMKDMQGIQGKVAELKEKHKGDSQRLNKETMALYKKEGINPMGGCLPMLLQMPVFIALYQVLQRTIALRQAPFFGWITDLSKPDVLFELPFALPVIGSSFCLLPLLMGLSMYYQQKMTTVDPRQKAMVYMMPILFTFLFYRLPSGLVLYWLVNNVLSIAQQWMIHRDGSGEKKKGNADGEKDT